MNCQYNTLAALFLYLAEVFPAAPALSSPGRPDLSFRALLKLLTGIQLQLNQLGIGPGDRVVLCAPANSPETATASLAIAAAATCAPLDPNLSQAEITRYLQQLEPDVILCFADRRAEWQSAASQLNIPLLEVAVDLSQPAGYFQLQGETGFAVKAQGWAEPQDTALIIMTSGSTGEPKLVPLTQAGICYSCAQLTQVMQLTSKDVCLNLLPLFHVHGLISNLLIPLAAGGKVVLCGSFNPDRFLSWLVQSQATWYSVSPTIHLAILKAITQNPLSHQQHALRFIRSGSAALSPQVIAELEQRLAVPLVEAYGMSEVPNLTSMPLPPPPKKLGSVGLSIGPEIAIIDESGRFLPQGAVGEIVVRGKNVTSGYLNHSPANQNAFIKGWFRTGDQGWLDEEGYLYLSGRLKEVINRGGESVSPQEVDNALLQLAEVEEAGTFAVAHPRLGEDVVAAVVLKPGSAIAPQDLRLRLFSSLAAAKIPSQIIIVDNLAKGRTGKLERKQLAQQLAPNLYADYTLPRTELESAIAQSFAQVLNQEKIGIHDNFFRLGGDSLLASQLVSRLRRFFSAPIPMQTLFEAPTTAELAQALSRLDADLREEYEEGTV